MKLNEIIGGFAATVGIETVNPDDAEGYTFEIDGMTVSFLEISETQELVTTAEIGELPDEGREPIFRYLMEAMFRDGGSGGAIFSLEPDSSRIWAHRRDSLTTMDVDSFRAMLERFVNGLEEWRRIVTGLAEVAPDLARAEGEKPLDSRTLELGSGNFLRV